MIKLEDGTKIPLIYKTTLSYMICRKPTAQVLIDIEIFDITSPDDSWNPPDEQDGFA